jgi:iron complex outermembrane receptor protein
MLTASAAVMTVLAPAAFAQDAPQEEGPELEDIVITADRPDSFGADYVQAGSFRGALQIDTPLTVSVIPEQLLKSQQAQGLLDALRNTPGVTSSQTSTTVYNNLAIRGIPVENRGNYRLNGALPIVNLIDIPLENKLRVEALKGASALYYGFTTPSGIINLTTKRPTKDPMLFVNLSGNDHGQMIAHVDVSGSSGIFGARINVAGGGVESGIDRTEGDRFFASGAFQVDLTDDIQLNLDVERIYKRVTEPTVLSGPLTAATLLRIVPALPSARNNAGGQGFYNVADETNVLGRASWDISRAWNVTVEGGISHAGRDRRFSRLNNFNSVTGLGTLNLTASDNSIFRNRNFRGEIAGTFATGPVVHELLIGASNNVRQQYSAPSVTITNATNCVALGLPATCVQSAYTPTPLIARQFSGVLPYDPTRDTSINDTGFYVFDRAKFGGPNGDLISILAGARKSIYRETVQTAAGGSRSTFEDEPLSLSGGLVIKPAKWASIYATYIEGLESTPGAPLTAVNAGEVLPASDSTQYEGGIKIEPKKGLLFTASYFDIRRTLTYTNAANVFVQDGQARYRGAELSLTGEVTPDLSIYVSALFLDAEQGLTSDVTLIGNKIENTAKSQWSVAGEYRLDALIPGLAINAAAYYTGSRAINPQNSLFLPSYTLYDIGGSYSFSLQNVEMIARVNAQNVTNERYFASTSGNFISYGAPAVVKFSLSFAL